MGETEREAYVRGCQRTRHHDHRQRGAAHCGCSGFQYGLTFDEQTSPDDVVFEHGGVTVVVDDVSLDLLNGAEVDFVEDLMGAAFQIKNPNAASSCGCGNSFSVA
jgi:iron-sulfur cluster insertion protein